MDNKNKFFKEFMRVNEPHFFWFEDTFCFCSDIYCHFPLDTEKCNIAHLCHFGSGDTKPRMTREQHKIALEKNPEFFI